MIPAYFVMDGTISITAKVKIGNHTRSRKISYYIRILQFPAFDFDSCASVKVEIVVPESLVSPANLFVTSETGVVRARWNSPNCCNWYINI